MDKQNNKVYFENETPTVPVDYGNNMETPTAPANYGNNNQNNSGSDLQPSYGPLINETDIPNHVKRYGNASDIPPDALSDDIVDIRPLNQEGGFSTLFFAHKNGLDVDVVIKRVKPKFKASLDETSEAHIMTRLSHPYLPKVYDLRKASDGYTYTVMEHIPGPTLREYVKANGPLPEKLAYKWTRQLTDAVNYMHTRKPNGIIHSDLKPENIIIRQNTGDICVIDFNASLQVAENGEELEAIGATPGFAAPEQYNVNPNGFRQTSHLYPFVMAAQGHGHISYRTDIYAIGALAYYMLTGVNPKPWFQGNPPLSSYNIRLGDIFRVIVEKAMQPRQENRYQSAKDMLNALTDLKQNSVRYQKWKAQNAAMIALFCIFLAGGVFLSVAGFFTNKREINTKYNTYLSTASSEQNSGNLSDAEKSLRDAIDFMPNFPDAYLALGNLLYKQGKYDDAINMVSSIPDAALKSEYVNESVEGQQAYIIANSYLKLEEYDKAEKYFDTAVSAMSKDTEVLRNAAINAIHLDETDKADKYAKVLESLDSTGVDTKIISGELSFKNGDYESAFEAFSDAALSSDDTEAVIQAALEVNECAEKIGADYLDQDIEVLEKVSEKLLASENHDVLTALADAYLNKAANAEGTEASDYYQKVIDTYDKLSDSSYMTYASRLNQALAYQELGRFDDASNSLDSLASDFPDQYQVPMRQAMLLVMKEESLPNESRDYSEFKTYFDKAESLYKASGANDASMGQLEGIYSDLQTKGWL